MAKSDAVKAVVLRVDGVSGRQALHEQPRLRTEGARVQKKMVSRREMTAIFMNGDPIYPYSAGDLLYNFPGAQADEVEDMLAQIS